MSGLEVLANLNGDNCPTRILFFAAAATLRSIVTAMADGAFGFLKKDVPPHELLHCIREAAAGRKSILYELLARSNENNRATKALPVEKLLTKREWKVMALAAEESLQQGHSAQIESNDWNSEDSLHHVFRKVGVRSRSALTALVARNSDEDATP